MGIRAGIRITRAEREALLKALDREPDGALPWTRLNGRAIYTANRLADAGHAVISRTGDGAVLRITTAGRKHLEEIT